jgi:hypothetical protein
MMFSLKLTMEPAAPPQFAMVVQEPFGRIFDFGRPILREGKFEPSADRPTRFDRTIESRWGIEAGLNIAEGSAAGAVEENAIEGVTDPAAHRSQPLALGLARDWRCHDRRNSSAGRAGIAMKIGPVNALRPKDWADIALKLADRRDPLNGPDLGRNSTCCGERSWR